MCAHRDLTLETDVVAKQHLPYWAGPLGRPGRALGAATETPPDSPKNPPASLKRELHKQCWNTVFQGRQHSTDDGLTGIMRVQLPAPTPFRGAPASFGGAPRGAPGGPSG